MSGYLDALETLKAKAGLSGVRHVSSFEADLEMKDGETQEVLIEVFDRGPEQPQIRYTVVATANGRSATGNACSSLKEAIDLVHWWKLEPPPEPTHDGPVIDEEGEPN